MEREGFRLDLMGDNDLVITSGDDSGALYGCLELARRIRAEDKLPMVANFRDAPVMKLRGTCIGMQKTYILPGRKVYEYPYTPELFPFFYDKKFWSEYLDFLVENRLNTLYLWNGHPFASLVRLKDYPYAVEVPDDVFTRNVEMFRYITSECDKRGIWLVQMFYNILVSQPFAKTNGISTQLSAPTTLTADYTRKSIAEFVKQYPNVGLMICLGEALQGTSNQLEWATQTILPGVLDGMKAAGLKEQPPVVVRTHAMDANAIMPACFQVYSNLFTESKYNGESLTTWEPRGQGQATHLAMSKLGPHLVNIHILSNLEPFRYGAQRFIQKSMQASRDRLGASGVHLYPLSYWNWPDSPDIADPPLKQWQRDWIWFEAWARYAWNPDVPEQEDRAYWISRLAEYYGTTNAARKILDACNDAGEIAPRLVRRFGITEGNRQTLSLGMTLDELVNPNRYGAIEDLWLSQAPPGERLQDYVQKEWNKQPHEGETPLSIVREVLDFSAKAVAEIDSAAPFVTRNRDEFERLRNDLRCLGAMSENYAAKANAAVHVLRYGYSQQTADMDRAAADLEQSFKAYERLASLTVNTYRFANSMQTSQRKIPVAGGTNGVGTNYHWTQLVGLYRQELADFQAKLQQLKAGAKRTADEPDAESELNAESFSGRDAGLVDTGSSPYAKIRSVSFGDVSWTSGFWAQRFEACRSQIIPGMWSLMEGTNYTQFLQNFRIAAGLATGRARGAAFNDGDFYKWLEGACVVFGATHDAELERHINDAIDLIAKAQRADGYLHTPIQIRQRNGDAAAKPFEDRNNWELYNMGHLLTAACVHYRVTGRTNLLAVARKTADFLYDTFHAASPELAHNSVCPSHYMGLVEIYRATRDARYLELAKKFFELRDQVKDGTDNNQDRIPFKQQTVAMGEAARANYLYAGAADLFMETGDRSLWTPLETIWTNVVRQKMYVTGGCGALYDGVASDGARDQRNSAPVHQAYGRNYQLPNLTAYNETCADIGNVMWNWRMFLVTGEARFMDVVELALYNSVLSGASLDGTNFFYVNPLRKLDSTLTDYRWSRTRVPFVNAFCCPPNFARTVAEVGDYAYGKSADAVWVNLYGGSALETKLPEGQKVKLTQETEYPWDGRVRLTINECGDAVFALKLRIPGWARKATVRLNGRLMDSSPTPGTYVELRRVWRVGDRVELSLPMPPRLLEANPLVEETLNQVAIQRGPVVYCLESTDLPKGFRLQSVTIPEGIDLGVRYDQRRLGGVAVLEAKALARSVPDWTGQLYRELGTERLKPVKIQLIPYFVWGNRGPSEMSVWLPLSPK